MADTPDMIFDRTEEDVRYVSYLTEKMKVSGIESLSEPEKSQWNAGLKGAYNYTDLNRVETMVEILKEELAPLGYSTNLQTKTDWTEKDIPTASEMKRYLDNVLAYKGGFFLLPAAAHLPESMNGLSCEGANAIEQFLWDIYSLISNIAAEFIFTGEIYAGEDDYI